MISRTDIEKVIEKKREVYRADYHQMVADFRSEKATAEGYNGRQLLELIQNCDDERAETVLIELDQKEHLLRISNTGRPFSLAGYRSLSISNLSAKTSKRAYIGNKGLGFRSVLTWSSAVKIYSNGVCLHYSETNRKKAFSELVDPKLAEKIREEQNFRHDEVPFAFLAVPEVTDWENSEVFTTRIELEYISEYEEDILSQLRNLKPETFLFLHNLKQIKFQDVEGCVDLCAEKGNHEDFSKDSFSPYQRVKINGESWAVFQKEEALGSEFTNERNEPEYYQVKLAIKDKANGEAPLYSFFPTRIQLDFPYILHATFDLDQNRNHINDTKKNKRVAAELAALIIETALYYTQCEGVSWKPLRLLTYGERNSELEESGFYEKLDEAVETKALYPCIDRHYGCQEEVYYVEDGFVKFLLVQGWEDHFSNHVLPDKPEFVDFDPLWINTSDLVPALEHVASLEMTPLIRAKFIRHCIECFDEEKLSILTDEQGRVISSETDIFTPPKEDLHIPKGYRIVTMHKSLYEELISELSLQTSAEKRRDLQRRLKVISNVYAYEPMDLAEKIIRLTHKELRERPKTEHPSIVGEMARCLFYNFNSRSTVKVPGIDAQVPLLTLEGTVKNARELCFSDAYYQGKVTSDLFESVYPDAAFLAPPKVYGLEQEDPQVVRDFYKWTGVNDYAVYIEKTLQQSSQEIREYISDLSSRHDTAVHTVRCTQVLYLDKILEGLSPEKFLLWVSSDTKLQSLLTGQSEDRYRGTNQRYDRTTPLTFVRWKVRQSSFNFETHLLEPSLTWLNSIQINYGAELFKQHGVGRSAINHALTIVGAKDEFIELNIDAVTRILSELPKNHPDGKNVQAIYKRAVDHYNNNQYPLSSSLELFAYDAESLKAYPQHKIFFSDRSNVPRQLRAQYPMLNYPSRSGATSAIEFFEINDLKEVEIEPINIRQDQELTEAFQAKFIQLKPFILAFRIAALSTEESKKSAARRLNHIEFHLCDTLEVETEHGVFPMEDYEFIPHQENHYYVKINRAELFEHLQQESRFMDAFADALCHAFDVRTDRSEYRLMLMRPKNDVQHTTKQTVGEHEIEEADSLLEYSEPKSEFLSVLYKVQNIERSSETAQLVLDQMRNLGIPSQFIVQSPRTEREFYTLKKLFEKTSLDVESYNKIALNPLNLTTYHQKKLRSYFNSREGAARSAIWQYLSKEEANEQARFLDHVHALTSHEAFIQHHALQAAFQFDIKRQEIYTAFLDQLQLDVEWNQAQEVLDLEAYKRKNLKQFSVEQQIQIDHDKRLRSLLYFDTSIEALKKEIAADAEPEAEEEENRSEVITPSNTKAGTYRVKTTGKHTPKRKKTGPYVPQQSGSDFNNNKVIGNRSENMVYDYLKKKYGLSSVKHAAAMDEGLHYDLAYTPNDWETTKYVEVKTYSNGFSLTPEEKQFGENHSADYEIWLVRPTGEMGALKNFFPEYANNLKISEYTFQLPLELTYEEAIEDVSD